MVLQLRNADDVKRLFSALGEDPSSLQAALSIYDADEASLNAPGALEAIDTTTFMLSLVVAVATGFSAIKGFERNGKSLGWGLTWGVLGFLMPLPVAAYAALKESN